MIRLIQYFLLFVTLVLALQVPVSAASLQDNLVPQETEKKAEGEVDLQYNQYPQHHYQLDTWVDTDGDWMPWNWADGAGKQIYIALNEMNNSIWSVNVLLANFTMLIVQEAFELDFVSNVTEEVGVAIQNIAGFGPGGFMPNGLWPLLVTFVIGIVGAWATYVGMVKRESSRAWGGLLSSIILFVFALGFFSNASTILKGLNDWSGTLQSDILAVSASIVNPGSSYTEKEGIATIRNQMFDLMVKKPYMLMQYGSTEVKGERVDKILSIDPYAEAETRSEKVQVEVEQMNNTMMSIKGVTQRVGFVPLLFVANTIIGLFLLIVSGSIILYQMIFLALVLIAPVPLLMALVPRWQQSAFDWAMKVLHAQLMKIAIALLLTILFGISAILYRATEASNLGYLGMMLLQIICFVGVWAKRKDLFHVVSTAVSNVETSTGATLQGYRQKYNQARNGARQGRNLLGGNNHQGKIRNQPLANRTRGEGKIGLLSKVQLAERKKQLQATKSEMLGVVASATMADRSHEEFQEGQESYKNRSGIENASVDREQLMDRNNNQEETTVVDGDVPSMKDGYHRRGLVVNRARIPLANRQNPQGGNREAAASVDRADMQFADTSNRPHSGRTDLPENQKTQEVRLREHDINDAVNRTSSHNENNERTVHDFTERNKHVTETNRKVHEHHLEKENITREVTSESVRTNSLEKRMNAKETVYPEDKAGTNGERGRNSGR